MHVCGHAVQPGVWYGWAGGVRWGEVGGHIHQLAQLLAVCLSTWQYDEVEVNEPTPMQVTLCLSPAARSSTGSLN